MYAFLGEKNDPAALGGHSPVAVILGTAPLGEAYAYFSWLGLSSVLHSFVNHLGSVR